VLQPEPQIFEWDLDDPQNILVSSEVADSLNEMRKTDQWSAQKLSISHSILGTPGDKKYLVPATPKVVVVFTIPSPSCVGCLPK
jgi:hypothetical protein